jgi:hypothetical protein
MTKKHIEDVMVVTALIVALDAEDIDFSDVLTESQIDRLIPIINAVSEAIGDEENETAIVKSIFARYVAKILAEEDAV